MEMLIMTGFSLYFKTIYRLPEPAICRPLMPGHSGQDPILKQQLLENTGHEATEAPVGAQVPLGNGRGTALPPTAHKG